MDELKITIQKTLLNAAAGLGGTFLVGSLGAYGVRFLQGQPLHYLSSQHPVMICTKVATLALPILYLYRRYGAAYLPASLRPAAPEALFFASAVGVLKLTGARVTPLLSLALVLTHLAWKTIAATEIGKVLSL